MLTTGLMPLMYETLVLKGLVVGKLSMSAWPKDLASRHHACRHGMNHDHVRAHLCDVGLYAALGTLPDGEHGDDRGHTDDNAQCSEKRPHLVGEDSSKSDLQ